MLVPKRQTWSLAFKEHHLVGRLGSGLVWTTLDGVISVCALYVGKTGQFQMEETWKDSHRDGLEGCQNH